MGGFFFFRGLDLKSHFIFLFYNSLEKLMSECCQISTFYNEKVAPKIRILSVLFSTIKKSIRKDKNP